MIKSGIALELAMRVRPSGLQEWLNSPIVPEVMMPDGRYLPINNEEAARYMVSLSDAKNNVKCECGCASIGVSKHSNWCPLWRNE